jgi:aspartate/methionine/tyrosine aminotransferase
MEEYKELVEHLKSQYDWEGIELLNKFLAAAFKSRYGFEYSPENVNLFLKE